MKTTRRKHKRTELIQSMLSEYGRDKRKISKHVSLNNILLNNPWVKEGVSQRMKMCTKE
jgi:hypothetical protein